MPCVNRREGLVEPDVAGLAHAAGEEARVEQVQDRVLDAADVLVDRHQRSTIARSMGRAAFVGSVKRAKYQDESSKVSMVSVSRRAGARRSGTARASMLG